MTTGTESNGSTRLSPDEAFAVLSENARLQVLRALGEATEPLSYSELFERVEYDDPSNFSYHLEKLVGHFVRKTDDGYELRRAGRRVVEAIVSGAVTDDPVFEPTEIDRRCPYCSAPIEVGFHQERVELYCSECPGVVEHDGRGDRFLAEYGSLGNMSLPPAGVHGRTPSEVLDAAWTWKHLDVLADSAGVCSRCSAAIDHSVTVCEDHDASGGSCSQCGRRYAVRFDVSCPNCHYATHGIAPARLLANTELLSFLTAHGINPLAPDALDRALESVANYEEAVLSTDPFEARFTFVADGDALSMTIDETLSVVDVTETRTSETG